MSNIEPEQPRVPESQPPTGHRLHQEAEWQREEGRSPDDFRHAATTAYDAAILLLQKGNTAEAAESHASQVLALRHFADTNYSSDDERNRFLRAEVIPMGESAVALARQVREQATRIPLYTLGKVYEDIGELEKARDAYSESIEIFLSHPESTGNIPMELELADMQAHLAIVEYKLGRVEILEDVDEAIKTMAGFLPNPNFDYERYVWLSGAHMAYAQAIASASPEEARTHLNEAQNIIQANMQVYPNLALRHQQLERIRRSLNILE